MSSADAQSQVSSSEVQHSTIYVEFSDEKGLRPVGLFSRKKEPELARKSNDALNKAMDAIKDISQRVHSNVVNIEKDKRPDYVEVEFGIKFDAEFGIMVAKLTAEASMAIKLSWDNNNNNTRNE